MLSSHSLTKRVQVDDNDVNGRDVVLINGCHVLGVVPLSEDATMDARVQCLYTTCGQYVLLRGCGVRVIGMPTARRQK